ncbi:amidohydrolase family protein [Streptomyces sp. PG2]
MRAHDVTYTPTLWVDDAHPDARANLRKVAEAGVRLALGSDTFSGRGLFGANTLEEAELMVAAGLSPAQVLAAGTSGAARACVRPDLGAVAPGKRADLLLLDADPTADIGALRRPPHGVPGQRAHRRQALNASRRTRCPRLIRGPRSTAVGFGTSKGASRPPGAGLRARVRRPPRQMGRTWPRVSIRVVEAGGPGVPRTVTSSTAVSASSRSRVSVPVSRSAPG